MGEGGERRSARVDPSADAASADMPGGVWLGLLLLAGARQRAEEAGRDPWDLALSVSELEAHGVSWPDVLALLERRLAVYRAAASTRRDDTRPESGAGASPATAGSPTGRVAATRRATEFLGAILSGTPASLSLSLSLSLSELSSYAPWLRSPEVRQLRPVWRRDAGELGVEWVVDGAVLGGVVLRRFEREAPNQRLLLDVLVEEGWAGFVLDPLPPVVGRDGRERLATTAKALSRQQRLGGERVRVLRFGTRRRGGQQGLTWRFAEPIPPALSRELARSARSRRAR